MHRMYSVLYCRILSYICIDIYTLCVMCIVIDCMSIDHISIFGTQLADVYSPADLYQSSFLPQASPWWLVYTWFVHVYKWCINFLTEKGGDLEIFREDRQNVDLQEGK